MSIFFALGLTLCSALTCNTYHIDASDTPQECHVQYVDQSTSFISAWNDTSSELPLSEWLEAQNIFEDPLDIIAYRFDCVELADSDTP